MPLRVKLLVFDLDGTLIDSTLDLALSVNATRANAGLGPLDVETISSYVGNGAKMLVRRALGPTARERDVQLGLAFFLRYYYVHMLDNTRLYDGVEEALSEWRRTGMTMAVLTNKPERFSRDLIAGLGLGGWFAKIYGGNSFATKKPDPYGLIRIMRELGSGPSETLMVGDSSVDVLTARNAGTRCAGVLYGIRPGDFERHHADITVEDMRDLCGVVVPARSSPVG
ncbi:MAG: HAD-IA family hydrolase [Bryobacterales bacterium]|nr:HAD-IA family hydrolase [Bryobacterales bacterium]